MKVAFIGIDNGSTGSIGIQEYKDQSLIRVRFFVTPVYKIQDFQKKANNISQLDFEKLKDILIKYVDYSVVYMAMERPVTGRFVKSMIAGARIHQQYLDLCQFLGMSPPLIVDSKQWQSKFLPKGSKKDQLKIKSKQLGMQRWPQFKNRIDRHGDADGLWISEWMRKEVMMKGEENK